MVFEPAGLVPSVTAPVLLEVVLPLEGLAARLAREGDVVLVRALVDHEVVGLGEAALAVLADELALGAHLAPELGPPLVRLHLHDGEHGAGRLQHKARGSANRSRFRYIVPT